MAVKPIVNPIPPGLSDLDRSTQISRRNEILQTTNISNEGQTVVPGKNYLKNFEIVLKDLDTADVPEWAKTNNLRRTRQVKVIDSTYDPALIYQNRKDRKEWACVGLCGQIPLRKNQPAGDRWLKVKEMNTNLDMWLVRG